MLRLFQCNRRDQGRRCSSERGYDNRFRRIVGSSIFLVMVSAFYASGSAAEEPVARREVGAREPGLSVPLSFDPSRRTVLLVHGIGSSGDALKSWREQFSARGIQVLPFEYVNDRPLTEIGACLSDELKRLAKRFPQIKLAIVAHSMGGLAGRYALEMPDRDPGCVADLFLVGTPNHGSPWARLQPHLEFIESAAGGRIAELLRPGWGRASSDLLPGSDFLKALNACSRNPNVRYHVVIGRRSFLRSDRLEAVAEEAIGIMERRGFSVAERGAVGDLLRSDELREGRGDGVVSIARADVDGASSREVVDLNHCELIAPSDERPDGTAKIVESIVRQLDRK